MSGIWTPGASEARRRPRLGWRSGGLDRGAKRRSLPVAALALAAVVVTNQWDLRPQGFGPALLNANWEFSWSHDLDSLLLASGLIAALVGTRCAGAGRRLWRATAVMLGLLLIDEVSSLHAQIGSISFGKTMYAPILLALVTCLWLLATDSRQRGVVALGLSVLFVAFAMHVVGLHLLRPLGYLNGIYQAGVGFKEGTELAGLSLVIPALWRLALQRRSVLSASAGTACACDASSRPWTS